MENKNIQNIVDMIEQKNIQFADHMSKVERPDLKPAKQVISAMIDNFKAEIEVGMVRETMENTVNDEVRLWCNGYLDALKSVVDKLSIQFSIPPYDK